MKKLSFLFVMLLSLSFVFAGTHTTTQILPGTFQGNYGFNGTFQLFDYTSCSYIYSDADGLITCGSGSFGDITGITTGLGSCTSGECVLTTLDGTGSNLDADTLDGISSAGFVAVSGDTMTGVLSMNSNKIIELATPTADTDAATKAYVDASGGGLKVYKSDGTTVLGDFIQMDDPDENTCNAGTLYTNSGTLYQLTNSDCFSGSRSIYFSSSGCSGASYSFYGTSSCTTAYTDYGNVYLNNGIYYKVGSSCGYSEYNYIANSVKDTGGTCTNGNYGYGQHYVSLSVTTPLCGSANCIIK